MICGSAGSKSRLAKAAGAEPCRQIGDGTLRAVVARSTFPMLAPLLEVDMSKNCTQLWREARSEVKMLQNTHHVLDHFWTVDMSKNCTQLWREAHFRSQNATKHKNAPHVLDHFWKFEMSEKVHAVAGAKHILHQANMLSKTRRFCSSSRMFAGAGLLDRICKDAVLRGRRNTRDTSTRDVPLGC